jgi:hypothetical protein
MDKQKANTISVILWAVGVVLILAGAFSIMAMKYAIFLGVAAFIIGGVVKKI